MVQKRMPNIEGLFLECPGSHFLIMKQSPCKALKSAQVATEAGFARLREELEVANFIPTRLRYEGEL